MPSLYMPGEFPFLCPTVGHTRCCPARAGLPEAGSVLATEAGTVDPQTAEAQAPASGDEGR